MQKASFRDN